MDINAISMAALSIRNTSCTQYILDAIYNAASLGLRECVFQMEDLHAHYFSIGVELYAIHNLQANDIQNLRDRGFVVTDVSCKSGFIMYKSGFKVEW